MVLDVRAVTYFGAAELIKQIPRKTRAVAVTECVCLTLEKTKFFEVFSLKDFERMEALEELGAVDKLALQDQLLRKIEDIHTHEKLLMDAMKLDYSFAEGRTQQSKLRKLAQGMKDRKLRLMQDLSDHVVRERKHCYKVT